MFACAQAQCLVKPLLDEDDVTVRVPRLMVFSTKVDKSLIGGFSKADNGR